MAIVEVKNRDGKVIGQLNTDDYIFNNNEVGFEPKSYDRNLFPYIKVNGEYYINDGLPFYSLSRADNSGTMMNKFDAYKITRGETVTQYFKEFESSFMLMPDKDADTGFTEFVWRSVPGFKIGSDGKELNCWTTPENNGEDRYFKDDSYSKKYFKAGYYPYKFNFSKTYERDKVFSTFDENSTWDKTLLVGSNGTIYLDNVSQGSINAQEDKLLLYYRDPDNYQLDSRSSSTNEIENGGTIYLYVDLYIKNTNSKPSIDYRWIRPDGGIYNLGQNYITGSFDSGDYFEKDADNWIATKTYSTTPNIDQNPFYIEQDGWRVTVRPIIRIHIEYKYDVVFGEENTIINSIKNNLGFIYDFSYNDNGVNVYVSNTGSFDFTTYNGGIKPSSYFISIPNTTTRVIDKGKTIEFSFPDTVKFNTNNGVEVGRAYYLMHIRSK